MDEKIRALEDGELTSVSGGAFGRHVIYYTVKMGETLDDIALRNNTTARILAQLNGIIDPGTLTVGRRIMIPSDRMSEAL